MSLGHDDWQAIILSLKLASVVTIALLIISTPLALWLSQTRSKWRPLINTIIALPLVLPPSVLGFYILILMSPSGMLGQVTEAFGLHSLAFTFSGLVIGSIIYSLPFVVQPIQNALEALGREPIEAAATLGAGPIDRFFSVTLPLAKSGFLTAGILGFTHTLGEFGIILMIGGNIPGETRVASVQIYDHVESLQYAHAHSVALILVGFSFLALMSIYLFRGNAFQLNANTVIQK